ncbi:MAG: DNA repair protein RecO [Defluviitaleaceae bacterium]|nr:DNA repair protein RecO [Defluviitaleaceae bacterium]
MSIQLEGIVLKSFDYQDHHKIVKLISPSHGLISVFVSYANQKKSKHRSLVEPCTCVTLHVKAPSHEHGGLYYLVQGDAIDSFYELKVDYEKVMMFYEMVEIMIKGDVDEIHLPYAYRLLKEILTCHATDLLTFRFLIVIFKAKMLVAVGLQPAIDGCISCKQRHDIVTASVSEGGLVCKVCYTGSGIWLTADLIPLWRGLFKGPIKRLAMLDVTTSQVELLETWMKSYYEGYSHIRFAKRLVI